MKYAFPALLVAVLLIIGGVYWFQQQETVPAQEPAPATDDAAPVETEATDTVPAEVAEAPSPVPAQSGALTMSVVATHNTSESCWTVVNGTVYDLTAWIARHPGGANAIIGLCGTDGTATFEGQHGGQSGPESRLAEFRVGALVE